MGLPVSVASQDAVARGGGGVVVDERRLLQGPVGLPGEPGVVGASGQPGEAGPRVSTPPPLLDPSPPANTAR